MSCLFDTEYIKDFDNSSFSPSTKEIIELCENISSVDSVIDGDISLTLNEARVEMQAIDDDLLVQLDSVIPELVTIPYVALNSDEKTVSVDIELADWLRGSQKSTADVSNSQLQETTAFVQASLEQIPQIKSAETVKSQTSPYEISIQFEKNTGLDNTHILNHIKNWISFSYISVSYSGNELDTITIRLSEEECFSLSSTGGFLMTQIIEHEDFAIQNQLLAELPCGHTSTIESRLFSHTEGMETIETVSLDGCEFKSVIINEIDSGIVRVGEKTEDSFIPIDLFESLICGECGTGYIFKDFSQFKETVCEAVRFTKTVGIGPENNEYTFAIPEVSPVEKSYIDSPKISIKSSKFDWVIERVNSDET